MPVLRLAIASPLRRLFDYLPPENAAPGTVEGLAPGCRVMVPFGSRRVCGILLETADTTEVPEDKLRCALTILDSEPLLSAPILDLCRWAAE